jgi:hypothetical protein
MSRRGERISVRRRLSAAVVGAGLVLGTSALPAAAQTAGGFDFGMRPYANPGAPARSAVTFEVVPGEKVADTVELVNYAATPKSFFIYPADAYSTEIGGGFALRLRDDPRRDAAAWITLGVSQYTVPPHAAARIPIELAVGSDATPGDHTAAVVAEEIIDAPNPEHGAGVVPVHRVGARVYVRVAGPMHSALRVEHLAVRRRTPLIPFVTGRGKATVDVTVANTGNTRVRLDQVEFALTGLFGRTVRHTTVDRPEPGTSSSAAEATGLAEQILPGSTVRLHATFSSLPPFEALTARVTVKGQDPVAGSPVGTKRSRTFWVVPWLVLALVVVLAAARWWRRRRPTLPEPAVEVTVPASAAGEVDLTEIVTGERT